MHADRPRSRRMVRERLRSRRYDAGHRLTRALLAPFVSAGLAACVRCGGPIDHGEPWDLGHDDLYPHLHSGPEHAACNRGAPNRNKTSRQW